MIKDPAVKENHYTSYKDGTNACKAYRIFVIFLSYVYLLFVVLHNNVYLSLVLLVRCVQLFIFLLNKFLSCLN